MPDNAETQDGAAAHPSEIEELRQEVERLRSLADKRGAIAVNRRREIQRLRLTDDEKAAIGRAIDSLVGVEDLSADACHQDDAAACTLRSLLDRLNDAT